MTEHSQTWPDNNSFAAFRAQLPVCKDTIYGEFFNTFREEIKVKRESAAVKNLQTIFNAIFALASKGSFDAVSLRDLSSHTGISMGGLYNYISSKENIADMAERFLGGRLADLASAVEAMEPSDRPYSPWDRLEIKLRIYIYMSSLFRPWYRFVFMEAKALTRPLKDQAKQFDIIDTQRFKGLIEDCVKTEQYHCINAQLSANTLLAMIQDWYIKSWKYTQQGVKTDQYADYLVATAHKLLATNDQETQKSKR